MGRGGFVFVHFIFFMFVEVVAYSMVMFLLLVCLFACVCRFFFWIENLPLRFCDDFNRWKKRQTVISMQNKNQEINSTSTWKQQPRNLNSWEFYDVMIHSPTHTMSVEGRRLPSGRWRKLSSSSLGCRFGTVVSLSVGSCSGNSCFNPLERRWFLLLWLLSVFCLIQL